MICRGSNRDNIWKLEGRIKSAVRKSLCISEEHGGKKKKNWVLWLLQVRNFVCFNKIRSVWNQMSRQDGQE